LPSLGRVHRLASLFAVSALMLLAFSTVRPHPASADADDHHPAGFVYVNENTTPNSVAGFARAADGTLTPLPGSPFPAGGQGLGTSGLGSQGGAELSQDGHLLFVVDAGSNQVSVLRVRQDGGLDPVGGSPFASNGA
jgi:hypothetical protein